MNHVSRGERFLDSESICFNKASTDPTNAVTLFVRSVLVFFIHIPAKPRTRYCKKIAKIAVIRCNRNKENHLRDVKSTGEY